MIDALEAAMADPTPRPWAIGTEHPQDFHSAEARPIKGGSRPIGQCWGSPYGKEVAEANARLIVTAVNCHDELVSALTGMYELVENGILVRDISKDHKSGWSLQALDLTKKLQSANAILAKVREQESQR